MPTNADPRVVARKWFLSRGLPLVLPPRERAHNLLRRVTPFVAFLIVVTLFGQIVVVVLGPDDDADLSTARSVALMALLVGMVVVAPLLGWLTSRLTRQPANRWAVPAVLVLGLVIQPVVSAVIDNTPWYLGVGSQLVTTGLIIGLIYLGVGSILGWAARFAWKQFSALGNLAGRALPLLMLTVVVFFTGELWQWSSQVDRAVVWRTVAFLAAVALAFMITSLRDEVRQIGRQLETPDEMTRLLDGTPLASMAVPTRRVRMSVGETINVIGVLVLSQAIQVVLFTLLVFGFFLALGGIMLPNQVVETWSGGPVDPGMWFGLRLPLSNELVQMSQFVAVLSGLYFTVHSTVDPQYRSKFFEPLVADVARSLAGRAVYRAAERTSSHPE